MKRFIKIFFSTYIFLSILLLGLTWHDLQSSNLFTGSVVSNARKWLEYWLFWEINYVVFMLMLCLLLTIIIFGLWSVVRMLIRN